MITRANAPSIDANGELRMRKVCLRPGSIARQHCLALTLFAAACASILVCPLCAQAREFPGSLTVELRAASTTSGTVLDDKHVLFTGGPGDSVRMNIWGVVTGQVNGTQFDDWIDHFDGSFLSSAGGLRGDLRANLFFEWFGAFGFNGTRQDLDGDGDLDVGSNDDSTFAHFFRAERGQKAPNIPVVQIGVVTWTFTGGDGAALVNFRPRSAPDAAEWYVDGVRHDPIVGPFVAGTPAEIQFVPEPSLAVHVVALAALVLGDRGMGGRCRSTGGRKRSRSTSPAAAPRSSRRWGW